MKIGEIYTQTTRERVEDYLKEVGYKVVAFRPPVVGDKYLGRPYGAKILSDRSMITSEVKHRLIVERVLPQ